VPYVRDSFFAGRSAEFASIPAMQADAVRWCRQVANVRRSRPLDGARPIDLFRAEEALALLALPKVAFELACWTKVKVHPDIHLLTELIQASSLVDPPIAKRVVLDRIAHGRSDEHSWSVGGDGRAASGAARGD
jgi:hypothetical protein